jgi:hypothetical protein
MDVYSRYAWVFFLADKGETFGFVRDLILRLKNVRSSDGVFSGYASHSREFRVLNLDTNLVMETCEVTLDETQPCNSSVFECACDDEVGKKIFEDEEDDAGEDDGDAGEAPATHVPSTSTTTTTV